MSEPGDPTHAPIDRTAVVRGVALAVAIAVPAGIAQRAVDDDSGLKSLLFLIILVAFGLGGAAAGRLAPGRPLTHGSIAGLVAVGAYLTVGLVVRLATSTSISVVALAFTALLGVSCALVGAELGDRRRRRLAASDDGPPEDQAEAQD